MRLAIGHCTSRLLIVPPRGLAGQARGQPGARAPHGRLVLVVVSSLALGSRASCGIATSPEQLRQNSDRPTAITNVLVATLGSSSHTSDIALGTPTCSARTRQGRWALYPNGDQVVVLWPDGALAGPPVEVARELNGLGGDHHDGLDHAAAQAIRQFLTDPATTDAARWSSTRTRTWSSPAVGYWLSGPTNQTGHHTHPPASRPGAPT